MAKEVVAHMGLVEAAQEKRAEAARMAAMDDLSPRLSALRVTEKGRVAGGASACGSSRGQGQRLPRFLSTAAEINAHWDNSNSLPQAERARALPSNERLHQASSRPHDVKVRPISIMVEDKTAVVWPWVVVVPSARRCNSSVGVFSVRAFSGESKLAGNPLHTQHFPSSHKCPTPRVQCFPCNRSYQGWVGMHSA